jgi:hypothetical protein
MTIELRICGIAGLSLYFHMNEDQYEVTKR